MYKTRRLVRLHLMAALLVLLPFSGFVWGVNAHAGFSALLGGVCLILAICIETLNVSTERDAMRLQLQVKEDRTEFDMWKEKVRELDRLVQLMSEENAEFRRQALDRRVHEVNDQVS